jgi:hypothetical protein
MISVVCEIPAPLPRPPAIFTVRSTEGHGTWKLTEAEARQLHAGLGEQIAVLDESRKPQ